MFDKLASLESRYDELMTKIGTAEVQADFRGDVVGVAVGAVHPPVDPAAA